MPWTCPNCSRQFRNTNQDHSCQISELMSHFANKQPFVIEIFERIKKEIMNHEGVKLISVKNAILFQANSNFLAVKPKKTYLDIEFLLPEKIEEFPVHKVVQATKTKFAHFVRIGSPEEVDKQIIKWLKMAFECCS